MAIDGIKILESDFAIDIQNEIFDLFDNGKSEQDIKTYLKKERKALETSIDVEIFVTASILSLWEIGFSDNELTGELKRIVKSRADKFWKECFDEKTHQKRDSEIKKLSEKIQRPNLRTRKRKKTKERSNAWFKKGDVLCVEFEEDFGCIIYNSFEQHGKDVYFNFVPTTYRQQSKPATDELLIDEIPVCKTKNGELGVRTLGIYYADIDRLKVNFEIIGELEIDNTMEKNGFSRKVSLENLRELDKEINNILEGEKTELYKAFN